MRVACPGERQGLEKGCCGKLHLMPVTRIQELSPPGEEEPRRQV